MRSETYGFFAAGLTPTTMGHRLTNLTTSWLFPGLLTSMVLGNQPWSAAQIMGQLAGWFCIAAATHILAVSSRMKTGIFVLLLGIVAAKVLRIVSGTSMSEAVYVCLVNALYCLAGAVVIYKRRELVYKQVMVVCLINVVVMMLQVSGAGAWTQLLTTHGEGNLTAPAKTLFVQEDLLDYLLVQGRPAGILYSNIILALIVLFGIVLHFSQKRARWRWTAVLCAIIVLCMSKAVFIGFGLTLIWVMAIGYWRQKILIFNAGLLVAIFLKLYGVLFPGLMAVNLGIDTITTSLYLRANDIMGALSPESSLRKFDGYLDGTPRASWAEEGEHISGYTAVLQRVDLVTVASIAVLAGIFYLLGIRRLRQLHPPGTTFRESKYSMILALMLLGAYPISFPIWTTPVYWFMMGLGLLPIIGLFRPQFIAANLHNGTAVIEPSTEQAKSIT